MHFHSWKFGIINGRKNLNTTGCRAFVLAMAMEIATKEIIFHSFTTSDLRYWISSQCLIHNFPGSILKQIKTQVERTAIDPRFKIDHSKKVYNFQGLFQILRRKENKTYRNEGLDSKKVKKILFFVVLYYNDLVVGFQRLIGACQKLILRFLINIYLYIICCKKINT